VHAHERGRGAFKIAANQCYVLIVIDIARIGDQSEIAEARGKSGFRYATNITLVLHAVADQIRDREHFEFVLAAKFDQLRHAGHRAVFIHDFADHAGGREAGDAGQINGGLGLPGANENAAVAGAQGKHVARASEILRASLGIDSGENGDGAIGGADAGGDAELGVDGFAEGGAVHRGIDRRHKGKIKLVATLFGERQADQSAAKFRHEVDGFRSDFFGSEGKIAFVLAVFVVDQDDHAPLADFFDGFFDGAESIGWIRHGSVSRNSIPGMALLFHGRRLAWSLGGPWLVGSGKAGKFLLDSSGIAGRGPGGPANKALQK